MHPNQIAVVVFPEPEEIKARASKRFIEMGKEVPAEAVNEMLGMLLMLNFSLHFSLPNLVLPNNWFNLFLRQLIMFCL